MEQGGTVQSSSSAVGTRHVLGSCWSGDGRDCRHAAGRGGGRDCGWSLFSSQKRNRRPPFTLLMDEVGRGQDAGGAGWHRRCRPARSSHRGTACSSPQGRTHRVGYTTQKTKARVEEKAKGTPNVPSGRRKSPAKAVLVQANIRQVPAHVRWCQRSRGTNRSRKDFRRDINLDGIIKYHH